MLSEYDPRSLLPHFCSFIVASACLHPAQPQKSAKAAAESLKLAQKRHECSRSRCVAGCNLPHIESICLRLKIVCAADARVSRMCTSEMFLAKIVPGFYGVLLNLQFSNGIKIHCF